LQIFVKFEAKQIKFKTKSPGETTSVTGFRAYSSLKAKNGKRCSTVLFDGGWDSAVSEVTGYDMKDCGSILGRAGGFSLCHFVWTDSGVNPVFYLMGTSIGDFFSF
jgi:hypothetical protein